MTPDSASYPARETLHAALDWLIDEMAAQARAVHLLRSLDIEPGPDPVGQVIQLARDVALQVTDQEGGHAG